MRVKYSFQRREGRSLPDGNQLLLLSFLACSGWDNSEFYILCQDFLGSILVGRRIERLRFKQSPLVVVVMLRFCLVHASRSYHLLQVNRNGLHWNHRHRLWVHRHHSHLFHDLSLLISQGLPNALFFKLRQDLLLSFWESWESTLFGRLIFKFELAPLLYGNVIWLWASLLFNSEIGLILIPSRIRNFTVKVTFLNWSAWQILKIQFELRFLALSFLKLHDQLIRSKRLLGLSFALLLLHDHLHKFPSSSFLDLCTSLLLWFDFSFFLIINPLLPIGRHLFDSQIVFLKLVLYCRIINIIEVTYVWNYLIKVHT